MLAHGDADMTTPAAEKSFKILVFYISVSALLWTPRSPQSSSLRYARAKTMLLDQKHSSKLCQETDSFEHACWQVCFMRPGCRNWHSTPVWENCLTWDLLVQDAIYRLCNRGIKILSLSHPTTFHYVRNSHNMTFGIFNLSENQYGLWGVTQHY